MSVSGRAIWMATGIADPGLNVPPLGEQPVAADRREVMLRMIWYPCR